MCGVMARRVPVFFGIFIGSFILMNGANAAIAINSCQVISSPGTYELQNNIINSSALISSDVTFDGQGLTIDGTAGLSYGVSVYSNISTLTNVTVKNLTVTGWYYGIRYRLTKNGRISDVNASSNGFGIYLASSN